MKSELNQNTKGRLSLDDFKVKKAESVNEIDKLLGGLAVASDCHQVTIADPGGLFTKVKYD